MADNVAYLQFNGINYTLEYKNELYNLDATTLSQAEREANMYLRLNYSDDIDLIVEYNADDQL